jgi:hypothetical protein
MSDIIAQTDALPSDVPFVTLVDAQAAIARVIADDAPKSGTRFGITRQFLTIARLSSLLPDGTGWRMGVSVVVPRFATLSCAYFASWGFKLAQRRTAFIIKASPESVEQVSADGIRRKSHSYTFLNGTYQLNLELQEARRFRDAEMRAIYKSTFETGDFEKILTVLRSELTGQKVF